MPHLPASVKGPDVTAGPALNIAVLAVQAGSADVAQSFRNDLDDALRTAALPFGAGAVVVVRRLALGRIPQGLSRQSLSRLIELRLGSLRYQRAGAAMATGTADAVVFEGAAEAAVVALGCAVAGTAMHWSIAKVFPAAGGTTGADAAARVIEALITECGPAALGRLVLNETTRKPVMDAIALVPKPSLVRILTALDALPVERRGHRSVAGAVDPVWTMRAATDDHEDGEGPVKRLAAELAPAPWRLRAVVLAAAERFGVAHLATTLVARAAADASGGGHAVDSVARAFATAIAASSVATASPRAVPAPPQKKGAASARAEALPLSGDRARYDGRGNSVARELRTDPSADEAPGEPDGAAGRHTVHAGLWLVIAALQRLEVGALGDAVGLPLGLSVMAGFAARLKLHEDDAAAAPLADAWTVDPHAPVRPRGPAGAPALPLAALAGRRGVDVRRFGAGLGFVGLAPALPCAVVDADGLAALRRAVATRASRSNVPVSAGALTAGVMLAAQRLVRLGAGRGWRACARTPGHVAVSATHLDVTFDARDLDVRVRLAGLDVDQGYVPWLQRVVAFHYDYSAVRDHGRPVDGGFAR